MIEFIKKTYAAVQSLFKTKFRKSRDLQTKDIIMKHLENVPKSRTFYNPAIERNMTVEEIREELEKRYGIQGQGISCMIPGKYSREYTDYFLGQLADFFEFDFFHNKKDDIISKLKPNQRLKLIREYLEKDVEETGSKYWLSPQSAIDSAKIYVKNCESDRSKKLFEDMMFFDSLIMNNKRNIDSFGFIVDKEKKNKFGNELRYEFVCFYDDYNSMFDYLNGITTLDEYENALMNVESWTDDKYDREYADDLGPRFGRVDHIQKLKELSLLTGSFKFKDNEQYKLDEIHSFTCKYTDILGDVFVERSQDLYLGIPVSVYQYHLHLCSRDWPDRIEYAIGIQEILNDPEKMKNQLERSKNYDPDKKKKEIPEDQQEAYQEYLEDKFYQRMWRNAKIRPKKLE